MRKILWTMKNVFAVVAVFALVVTLAACGNDHKSNAEFTVFFNSHGGTVVAEQTVRGGARATRPETDPTREGWTFVNWYDNATLGAVFNFHTKITVDTTIHARWSADAGTPSVLLVAVSPLAVTLQMGGVTTKQLTATVTVMNGAAQTVIWASSDDAIATVSTGGLVTAHSAGVATITATSTVDDTKVGACAVVVAPVPDGMTIGQIREGLGINGNFVVNMRSNDRPIFDLYVKDGARLLNNVDIEHDCYIVKDGDDWMSYERTRNNFYGGDLEDIDDVLKYNHFALSLASDFATKSADIHFNITFDEYLTMAFLYNISFMTAPIGNWECVNGGYVCYDYDSFAYFLAPTDDGCVITFQKNPYTVNTITITFGACEVIDEPEWVKYCV
jgi:uncharacterized repeat protein (TIGR02543 family)